MDWSELVLHPVRLRVLQYLRVSGEGTAKEIAESIGEVPRATVYRHVKALEGGGAIKVSSTRRVRGATEKTYVLSDKISRLDREDARGLSSALHIDSMGAMDDYLSREGADPEADRVFFQTACIWVTDEEYDEVLGRIAEAIEGRLDNVAVEGRRLRTLSIVSAPPNGLEAPAEEGRNAVS